MQAPPETIDNLRLALMDATRSYRSSLDDIPSGLECGSNYLSRKIDIGKGVFREADVLNRRYRLVRFIGSGSSGVVWESRDVVRKIKVAVKVFHGTGVGGTQSEHAIRISHHLNARPEISARLMVEFTDRFLEGDRWCIVSELCGMSLRKLLDNQELAPLQARQVRSIAWQVVKGVAFMHRAGIIHTDIKPDNIVLVDGSQVVVRELDNTGVFNDKIILKSVEIKIVDFDDAVHSGAPRYKSMGTNRYRAPEVTLGIPWDLPVDAFSVGCVLAELYIGRPLFLSCLDSLERLAALEVVVGYFPPGLIKASSKARRRLFHRVRPYHVAFPPSDIGVDDMETSEAVARIAGLSHISLLIRQPNLGNLVRRLLCLDPQFRMTLDSAVRHEYFDDFRVDV